MKKKKKRRKEGQACSANRKNCIRFILLRMQFCECFLILFVLIVASSRFLVWKSLCVAHDSDNDNAFKTHFVYFNLILQWQTKATIYLYLRILIKLQWKSINNHWYARIKIITLFRLLAPHRVGIDVFVTNGFWSTGSTAAAAACCREQPMPRRLLYHLSWRSSTYVIFAKSKRIFQHRTAQRVVCFTSSPPLFTLLRRQKNGISVLFVYFFLFYYFLLSFRCYYCKIEFLLIFFVCWDFWFFILFFSLLKFCMSHYTSIGYIDWALSHSIGWFNWCFYSLVKCSHSWSWS